MLNLAEYRTRTDRLADHLPWAALVAPGVILNKDGSFQRSFEFRGPDLESATEAELVSVCARTNNALKRLGTGWALFFEADRRPAPGYPEGRFPDATSWLVDAERRAGFETEGQHFESHFTGTLVWLPPADGQEAAGRALVERAEGEKGRDWRAALSGFIAETDRLLDLLAGFMPEVRALSDSETLTFLHRTISDRPHPVSVPDTPVYLDALLPDTMLTGGLEPRLGELHLRTLTLLGFPNLSRPGLLDALRRATGTSTGRRCFRRRPAARRRSASRRMSAMSGTCWWSGQPVPANPCCWRSLRCSSAATPTLRSSCSTRDCPPALPCWRWAASTISWGPRGSH
jgi:type IV secretion system protein VirB4